MTTTTKPSRKTEDRTKRMAALAIRQQDEGYCHGYLGHEVRGGSGGALLDDAVLAWLDAHGYDAEDAYEALNSRPARHMGDALQGARKTEWNGIIASHIWATPAAMWKAFGTTKPKPAPGRATRAELEDALVVLADHQQEAEKEGNMRAARAFNLAALCVNAALKEVR